MFRPFVPPAGGVGRDDLIRRLIFLDVKVEGPAVLKLLSTDLELVVQPLTDPVPHEVLRSIHDRFFPGQSIRILYQDAT